ncbi:sensor histidine kinase [Brachybacterium sp. YJGR34]|uniref:sensor histidine kinase n=1 Tax=Brachybacterium sp. YJGR34 TaxID=2059911 RepID=UPI0018E5B8E5|nr:histidine kinase [Brachybacterium sp. YJGR34]
MSVRASTDEGPHLTWFLRVDLFDRVVLLLSISALIVQGVLAILADRDPWTLAATVAAAAGVGLARRRRALGLLLVVLAAVGAALLATEYIAPWTVVVMTLLSVTLRGTPAVPAAVLATLPVYGAIVLREGEGFGSGMALTAVSLCVAAAATGTALRAQARFLEAMRQRALDAVATRDLAVERGIARERLRIAQDLHDAVGHEIAVVGMQLGAAQVQVTDDTGAARASMQGAREGVQRVLRETQQILDILRHGAGEDTGAVADVRHLGDLVETLRAASVPVEADLPADFPNALPPIAPQVSAAAYRIAQEALTNARRHGSGRIALTVRVEGEHLVVQVTNDRRADQRTAAEGSGYGLVGMQERATSVGGRLEIDDDPRRFAVTAVLHLEGKGSP